MKKKSAHKEGRQNTGKIVNLKKEMWQYYSVLMVCLITLGKHNIHKTRNGHCSYYKNAVILYPFFKKVACWVTSGQIKSIDRKYGNEIFTLWILMSVMFTFLFWPWCFCTRCCLEKLQKHTVYYVIKNNRIVCLVRLIKRQLTSNRRHY